MDKRTCTIDGCERPLFSTGWCSMHYARVRRGNPLGPPGPAFTPETTPDPSQQCVVEGCGRARHAKRLCFMHYKRVRKHGSVDPRPPTLPMLQPCGTYAAAMRHRRDGEEVCPACREAERLYSREQYKVKPHLRRGTVAKRDAIKRAAFVEHVDPLVVFERDKWTCQACRTKLTIKTPWPAPLAPVLDHIVPLSVGGEHSYANTQTLCNGCNIRKGPRAANDQLRLIG